MLKNLCLVIAACTCLAFVMQGCGGGESDSSDKPAVGKGVAGGGAGTATKPQAEKPGKSQQAGTAE